MVRRATIPSATEPRRSPVRAFASHRPTVTRPVASIVLSRQEKESVRSQCAFDSFLHRLLAGKWDSPQFQILANRQIGEDPVALWHIRHPGAQEIAWRWFGPSCAAEMNLA